MWTSLWDFFILNRRRPAFWIAIVAVVVVVCICVALISDPGILSTVRQKAAVAKNISEVPDIRITVDGAEIGYIIGLNQWGGIAYDREDTFQSFMKGKSTADLPYIKIGREFKLEFLGTAPDSVELQEYILNENGTAKYSTREIKTIPIEFENGKGSFVLAVNPATWLSSNSADYEPGASIRGFRLVCSWGKNEAEYAFIIHSDVR